MQIHIDYFAILREQAGRQRETLQTDAKTPAHLYLQLCEQYGFELIQARLRVAINDEFCDWSQNLS
ncbi:MAG: MoaD/ThiS family protein, partial [Gammaproteobacteria bacterium]|nr:MoaD/ThiS family protein [Gammaproteobacteria bacterium]